MRVQCKEVVSTRIGREVIGTYRRYDTAALSNYKWYTLCYHLLTVLIPYTLMILSVQQIMSGGIASVYINAFFEAYSILENELTCSNSSSSDSCGKQLDKLLPKIVPYHLKRNQRCALGMGCDTHKSQADENDDVCNVYKLRNGGEAG